MGGHGGKDLEGNVAVERCVAGAISRSGQVVCRSRSAPEELESEV